MTFKKGHVSWNKGRGWIIKECDNPQCNKEFKSRIIYDRRFCSLNCSYSMRISWNKGLTKEIDKRVKQNAENTSKTMKRLHKEGKLKIWSKGKTLTDFNLKRCGDCGRVIGFKEHSCGIHPMLGKHHTDKTKKIISDKNKGKYLSPSTMFTSERIKKMWEDEYYKNKFLNHLRTNHPMKGKQHTEGAKLKNRLKHLGEKNSNWQDGISFEPYTPDFNKQFKESIKERDNYTCQLCSLFEEDAIKLQKRKLAVHHIDYDKKNSFPQNCITLCLRCNTLVNKDREIWTKHFQELLKKLYKYEYTQDQKIILDFTK